MSEARFKAVGPAINPVSKNPKITGNLNLRNTSTTKTAKANITTTSLIRFVSILGPSIFSLPNLRLHFSFELVYLDDLKTTLALKENG